MHVSVLTLIFLINKAGFYILSQRYVYSESLENANMLVLK